MENELTNTVTAVGNYNSIPTSITSTASVVTMIDGLTITKTPDKTVWADGELTYTIVVSNQTEKAYENPIITDKLDTTLVEFIDGSVIIEGSAATSSEYIYNTDTLTINLTTINANDTKNVSFKVRKK